VLQDFNKRILSYRYWKP